MMRSLADAISIMPVAEQQHQRVVLGPLELLPLRGSPSARKSASSVTQQHDGHHEDGEAVDARPCPAIAWYWPVLGRTMSTARSTNTPRRQDARHATSNAPS